MLRLIEIVIVILVVGYGYQIVMSLIDLLSGTTTTKKDFIRSLIPYRIDKIVEKFASLK